MLLCCFDNWIQSIDFTYLPLLLRVGAIQQVQTEEWCVLWLCRELSICQHSPGQKSLNDLGVFETKIMDI